MLHVPLNPAGTVPCSWTASEFDGACALAPNHVQVCAAEARHVSRSPTSGSDALPGHDCVLPGPPESQESPGEVITGGRLPVGVVFQI